MREAAPEYAEAESFRLPLPVTAVLCFGNGDTYPVCPRCGLSFDREYQAFCDHCGQCLDWGQFHRAVTILKF